MKKYIYITSKNYNDKMFLCDDIKRIEMQQTIDGYIECNWLTFFFEEESSAMCGSKYSIERPTKEEAKKTLKHIVEFLENDYRKILHIEKE